MSNPFEHKFTVFSANLSEKNAAHTKETIETKSGEVFADKPFSIEYKGIYNVTKVGQLVAQVVTFLTTAALAVFALTHIVPLSWGIYIAVPLSLLFAYGVEKIKRSTLAIAAKHYLKYGQFGAVGVFAMLVMCVSIAAALYGAKELPGVVYAKPERALERHSANDIQKQIDVVQSDINRLQSKLDSKAGNWVAENRTLPKLQRQRAELISQKTQFEQQAGERSEIEHTEALTDRQEKVEKMQVYAVGAAIVAELIFLFCTVFIFYFLFRQYAHSHAETAPEPPGPQAKATNGATQQNPAPAFTSNGNGLPKNERHPIGFAYANRDAPARTQTVETQTVNDHLRNCEHCGTAYIYGHRRQKFCTDQCRIDAWQDRTGRKLKRTGTRQETT